MNTGYEPGMRTRMYATAAAEAAAFTSLRFVALTVNLPRILPGASRVARAAEALGGLRDGPAAGFRLAGACGPVPVNPGRRPALGEDGRRLAQEC